MSVSGDGESIATGVNLPGGGKTKSTAVERGGMAIYQRHRTIEAASANEDGTSVDAKRFTDWTMYVIAQNFDDVNDALTVTLQASPDGTNWADVDRTEEAPGSNKVAITEADLEQHGGAGNYVAEIQTGDLPADEVRAVLENFTDAAGGDLVVDVFLCGVQF